MVVINKRQVTVNRVVLEEILSGASSHVAERRSPKKPLGENGRKEEVVS